MTNIQEGNHQEQLEGSIWRGMKQQRLADSRTRLLKAITL